MTVDWSGGDPTYYAQGVFVMYGPMIERVCTTKIGARFAAWRRRRRRVCSHCDGHGFMAGAHTERVEPCPACDGSGVSNSQEASE